MYNYLYIARSQEKKDKMKIIGKSNEKRVITTDFAVYIQLFT